jgi:hypothetical protein
METVEVRIARLEERTAAVQTDVTDIRADQKTQNAKLDQLLAGEHRRKGAQAVKKALGAVAGSSGIASLIAWAYEHFNR